MQVGTATLDLHASGMSFRSTQSREDEGGIPQSVNCVHGNAGEMGTDTDRTVTTTEVHGLSLSDDCDVYWTDAGTSKIYYGVTVKEVVSTKIVKLNADGSGDALPADSTDVIIAKRSHIVVGFDGDDVSIIAAYCGGAQAHLDFVGPDVQIELTEDIPCWFWIDGMGWYDSTGAVPLAGAAVTAIDVSTAATNADKTFTLGGLYDSVA